MVMGMKCNSLWLRKNVASLTPCWPWFEIWLKLLEKEWCQSHSLSDSPSHGMTFQWDFPEKHKAVPLTCYEKVCVSEWDFVVKTTMQHHSLPVGGNIWIKYLTEKEWDVTHKLWLWDKIQSEWDFLANKFSVTHSLWVVWMRLSGKQGMWLHSQSVGVW